MRCVTLGLAILLAATPLAAKPLITNSEETHLRLCLARDETPARIISLCDAALAGGAMTHSQRVDALIARADGFLWADDYASAAAGYREATEADPASADAWNGLGWALRQIEGDEVAFGIFETSLAVEVTVQGLGGKAATGRGSGAIPGDAAREILRAALTIDPSYVWAIREIGWSHLDDDRPEDAARTFREALAIDAGDQNARYGLGRASLASGDADTALATFNEVLSDTPGDFATRVYRIIALRDLDRNAQALRDADRLISDFPDRSSGYIEKGHALMALQRRREAIDTLAVAHETLGPNNAVLYWYADALATDGRFERALDVIDRGIALEGADYSDHLLKSYIALEMKNYPLTRDAAEAALETAGDNPWAHYYIAITMVHSGDTPGGLTRFERAMETGLPDDRVGAFAKELISAGKYIEAAQLRLRY